MRWLRWIDAACAAACHSHPPPDGHCCKLWAVPGSNIKESHLCKICVHDVCLQGRKELIICWKTEGDKKEFENRREAAVENESVPRWVWSCTLTIFTLLGAVVLPEFTSIFHIFPQWVADPALDSKHSKQMAHCLLLSCISFPWLKATPCALVLVGSGDLGGSGPPL